MRRGLAALLATGLGLVLLGTMLLVGASQDSVSTAQADGLHLEGGTLRLELGEGQQLTVLPAMFTVDGQPVHDEPTYSPWAREPGGLWRSSGEAQHSSTSVAWLEQTPWVTVRSQAGAAGAPVQVVHAMRVAAGPDDAIRVTSGTGEPIAEVWPGDTASVDVSAAPNVVIASGSATWAVVASGSLDHVDVHGTDGTVQVDVTSSATSALDTALYVVTAPGAIETAFEVAHRDVSELGTVRLDAGGGAGVGWVGSAAEVSVTHTASAHPWSRILGGAPAHTWSIDVEAEPSQAGKSLRILMDRELEDRGRLEFNLDGQHVSPATDDAFLVQIDHFSLRTVQVSKFSAGVHPMWGLLAFGFGTVAAGEGFLLGRGMLRSRAAQRGLAGDTPAAPSHWGTTPKSAAARRALSMDQEFEVRSQVLRRLDSDPAEPTPPQARYSRCLKCSQPLRFEPDDSSIECPKCGADNLNPQRMT